MANELTTRNPDLEGFGAWEVCGEVANTLTRDLKITCRIDQDFPVADAPVAYVEHRFCTAHRRGGTVAVVRESQAAYFARLRATEGAEI